MHRALILLSSLLIAASVGANDLAIRTIDMQYIFDNYYKTLRFEKAIVDDADMVYLESLEKQRDELRETIQRLRAKANSLAMTDEAKAASKEEGMRVIMQLQEKDKDIDRMRRKIDRRKAEERDVILNEIETVVVNYSKENGIDLLLDLSGRTLNGIPSVVYAKETLDISKTMLALLNAGHEDELAEMKGASKAKADELEAAPAAADEDAREKARKAAEDAIMEGGAQ